MHNHLSLNASAEETARFFVRRISRDVMQNIISNGIWSLAARGDDRIVWERLLVNDLAVLYTNFGSSIELAAVRILDKSLDLNIPKSDQPLLISLALIGKAVLKHFTLHGWPRDFFWSLREFTDLWNRCAPVGQHPLPAFSPAFYSWNGIDIRVASSQSDINAIRKFAKLHSFGGRKAYLSLIAEKNGKRLGAILGEPSSNIRHPHRFALAVFGKYYEHIRGDSMSIVRILHAYDSRDKLQVHEALVRAFIGISEFAVDGPLRIIEGVSYDYHPLSLRLGFSVEVPQDPAGSFYYWKPIEISKGYIQARQLPEEEIKSAVHALLKQRERLQYFVVYARTDLLEKALVHRAWALEDTKTNKGTWKNLREGNIVFFLTDHQYLNGYGVVRATKFDDAIHRYPLRIDFSALDIPFANWDITDGAGADWAPLARQGGISPLPERAGSEFKSIVDYKYAEGKMWVIPNQYLLPGADFNVIPKQVFVVQAWALRDSILPAIREILTPLGYSVTHAEDREGQIVFGDIWKLLNEAEVVIVDFTEKRPNVYLEYGMALVLGKPIVALSQDLADTPSDTPHLKVLKYENSMAGKNILTNKLPRAIKDTHDDVARLGARGQV